MLYVPDTSVSFQLGRKCLIIVTLLFGRHICFAGKLPVLFAQMLLRRVNSSLH